MISLQDITIIIQLYEKKNFSSVAESAYIGQSALSRKIKRIEDELGYSIFNRNRGDREVTLTEKGMLLLPILYDVKALYKKICDIKDEEVNKNIRIASTDGPFFLFIDSVVENILKTSKNYSFELRTANFNECIGALIRDNVDIAFVGKESPIKNIKFTPLYREDVCLVAKKGYFKKKKITPSDLDPSKSVISPFSEDMMKWFDNTFDYRKPLIQCDLNTELERFIISKNLWSIVPTSLAKDFKNKGICTYNYSESIPKRIVYYAIKQAYSDSSVSKLISEIRMVLGNMEHIRLYNY